jgi:hypothetical protein
MNTIAVTNAAAIAGAVLLGALIFATIGAFIGARKGLAVIGFLLGLVFGPIGVLVVLIFPGRGEEWAE